MFSLQKLLVQLGLLLVSNFVTAQNPDILWQKTLTKDNIPISSIAIAEGKYVAALKGDEIVILDYNTGDSIKVFPKPKDMYGTDIILGKGGERLYVFVGGKGDVVKSSLFIRSWNIETKVFFNDIEMSSLPKIQGFSPSYLTFLTANSLDGKFICVGTTYQGGATAGAGSGGTTTCINTEDSTFNVFNISKDDIPSIPLIKPTLGFKYTKLGVGGGGMFHLSISHSGSYMIVNWKNYMEYYSGGNGYNTKEVLGNFVSLSTNYKSYLFSDFIPAYTFSFDEDFLLLGLQLYDFPPKRVIRSITKTGSIFLSGDNHMLAFHEAGGVAAISNIEKDRWEKVYHGDSLTENIIQTNASRSAFATVTNHRITLWKIPTDLKSADLTANFSFQKDTILIGDTVFYTNKTYPFKRGNNYVWKFGDGYDTSDNIHPFHIYRAEGIYPVNLEAQDTLGRVSVFTKNIVVKNHTTAIESTIPNEPRFSIIPNPSYGETTLRYALSQPANIQIKITDVLGREICSWALQEQTGEHSLLWNSTSVGAGMYYCTFTAGSIVHTIPFVVMQ